MQFVTYPGNRLAFGFNLATSFGGGEGTAAAQPPSTEERARPRRPPRTPRPQRRLAPRTAVLSARKAAEGPSAAAPRRCVYGDCGDRALLRARPRRPRQGQRRRRSSSSCGSCGRRARSLALPTSTRCGGRRGTRRESRPRTQTGCRRHVPRRRPLAVRAAGEHDAARELEGVQGVRHVPGRAFGNNISTSFTALEGAGGGRGPEPCGRRRRRASSCPRSSSERDRSAALSVVGVLCRLGLSGVVLASSD